MQGESLAIRRKFVGALESIGTAGGFAAHREDTTFGRGNKPCGNAHIGQEGRFAVEEDREHRALFAMLTPDARGFDELWRLFFRMGIEGRYLALDD